MRGTPLTRPGPWDSSRVGKMEKVVKRRGVSVLILVEEKVLRRYRVAGSDLVLGGWGRCAVEVTGLGDSCIG